MRLFYMLLGSIMTIVFLIQMLHGKKYAYMVENLESGDYPLKNLYGVGFSWGEKKLLSLKGKIREKLIGQAKLLYDVKYAEYYASITWAQMLTFVHLGILFGCLLAGLVNSGFMFFIGLLIAVLFGYYFLNHMNDLLKTREAECTSELPEVVSTMALLINAGMVLRDAWRIIAESKEGTIYELMRRSCDDMENGVAEVDAIHKFGRLSNSAEIRKFTSALAQSIERGGAELNDFLSRQSIEIWTLKKQLMLQKGEAAASKLLAPTAMLFVGIIIAVISGALGMLI